MLRLFFAFFMFSLCSAASSKEPSSSSQIKCLNKSKIKPPERNEFYKDKPYRAGEVAKFEMRYARALVGYGYMRVKPPIKYKGVWHRNFFADAKTGDWYKMIFVAEDKINAIVRPWDYGISKFYIEQDEGKMFGRRLQQKKWLEFNHDNCVVEERINRVGRSSRTKSVEFENGALDTLGVVYWLRERDYKIGKTERALVYSSEKNWWLEATPIQFEEIQVPAGKFQTVKLKLQTFIGKELQQKGEVFAWFDRTSKDRPLVRVQAEIAIGSVWIELAEFKPGSKL